MQTYAIYLWPRAAARSEIGSDTLFGAVCWAMRLLGLADIDQLLARFEPPRFGFSSTFPVYQAQGQMVRFFPKPIQQNAINQPPDALPKALKLELIDRAKRLSKTTWVSETLFNQIVTGQADVAAILARSDPGRKLPDAIEHADNMLITQAERQRVSPRMRLPKLIRRVAVQHNHIDRVAGATLEGLLFYTDETHYAPGAGLWGLLVATEADAEKFIRPALRYLADTGLGADRSTGKGHFAIEMTSAPILPDAGQAANSWVSLSRYLPCQDEWRTDSQPLAYRLINLWSKREQGYPQPRLERSAPVYKRRLRMFEPGSVFPLMVRKKIYGRLAVVVPGTAESWPIYQSGLALGVSANMPNIGD